VDIRRDGSDLTHKRVWLVRWLSWTRSWPVHPIFTHNATCTCTETNPLGIPGQWI
jgi:hypothetical protein